MSTIITGTGAYLPEAIIPNKHFTDNKFFKSNGTPILKKGEDVVAKLESISGIKERRYLKEDQDSADLGAEAGLRALLAAGLNGEKLDGIIVAHNSGNVLPGNGVFHTIPNLASRVKHKMNIKNHRCFAYDIIYGCPGWVQAFIQGHQAIAMGDAKRILIIAIEVLSRLLDPHDMDSMLFGDGAGATVLEVSKDDKGVLAYQAYTHAAHDVEYINFGESYHPEKTGGVYIKMQGTNVYKYAVTHLPKLVTETLEKANVNIKDVSKFLFHQANGKMIKAIGQKLFKMHDYDGDYDKLVPIILENFGNTSVATIPTLLDMMMKGELPKHSIKEGDIVAFVSVGAGMHANCLLYKF